MLAEVKSRTHQATTTPSVSVVIPVYQSAQVLPQLIQRLVGVMRGLQVPFEVLLVNDGSRDNSWEIMGNLAREFTEVRGINLSRNFGQHNAVLCGVRAAQYEAIVTMDDDLQHLPETVPTLLAALTNGVDVVYGAPEHQQHGWWRNLASRSTKMLLEQVAGGTSIRQVGAFRAFRTRLRLAFADYRSPSVCLDVLLAWGTSRFAVINVPHEPRRYGVSNYTFFKLVAHLLNMFTGFSTLPLRLASWVGFGSTVLGILLMLWVIGNFLVFGSTQPGFPFLASIISLFAGAQMFTLGILGEYIARVHFRLLEKPAYLVESDTAQTNSSATWRSVA